MTYTAARSKLNPKQLQAVEKIYGPVLVLAGPGTGKTQMLTCRIAEILAKTDANPSNILCLTFTEAATVEMRNRLQKWIGADAYQVKISTFHGFCQSIMDRYPHIFEAKIGPRQIADDLQKALAYQAAIKSKKWQYFQNVWDEFYAQREVLSSISQLKREHFSPEKIREILPAERERLEADPANFYTRKFKQFSVGDWKPQKKAEIETKIAKLAEFCDLWEVYKEELKIRGFFDFDDQINWVVEELQTNENLRLDLQEQYQWILVDEYQDTNNAQNEILWQLTEGVEDANIFAVGDDDQSIYRFQGASVANVQTFRAKFPDVLEVTLEDNYRSHQHILDAAYSSVSKNLERANTEKHLVAQNTPTETSFVRASFGSRYAEINWLVEKIRGFFATGIPAHEIAILVRKNREIAELARELPKFGIPVSAQISQNIFENETVRMLTLMLQIFTDEKYDEKLFDLLHAEFLTIDPAELLKLSLERNEKRTSIIKILLENPHEDEKIRGFFEFFIQSRQKFWHLRPAVLAEKLLYESGLAQWLTKNEAQEDWQNIRKFIDWIREQKLEKSAEILERIDIHQQLGISVRPDPLPADKQSVKIMTAHKSKGQEFEAVLISGLEDKKWGNPYARSLIPMPHVVNDDDHDVNEEERRLFFVALTRAKAHIGISYAQTDFSGRKKNPSLFWHEIPEHIVTDLSQDETEAEVQKLLPIFFQHQEKTLTAGEKDLLKDKVQNFVWSASSLQNYLDCPRRFLYQNLYRFPRRPQPHLALGVALHQALELFFKSDKKSADFLLEQYKYALSGQNIPREEFQKWFEHGTEILTQYYEKKLANFLVDHPHGYELEYNFRPLNPSVDGIRITGKIDKLVFQDADKKSAKIVDYKSGKPRAIKSGERLWRQLVFYDLLAKNTPKISWKTTSCELDFLTPDSKGTLGTKALIVTDEDRNQVLNELQEANTKLQNLEFPAVPNPEGDADIEFWNNFGN